MTKQFSEGDIPSRETDKVITIIGGVNNTLSDTLSSVDKSVVPLGLDDEGRIILSAGVNGISKAEDSAHASGSIGTFILGVRNDSFATFADTNGDYTPFATTPRGELKIVVEHTSQGTPAIGLLKLEDAPAASADAGVGILQVRTDTLPNNAGVNTNGDYANLLCDVAGRTYVNAYGTSVGNFIDPASAVVTDTSSGNIIIAAGGAGVRYYITEFTITNTSGVATLVTITDGTTSWYLMAEAGKTMHYTFQVPKRTAANAAVTFTCATTASSTRVMANGYAAQF